MNLLHEDLARAIVRERLATAEERRRAVQALRAHRHARRRSRRQARRRPWLLHRRMSVPPRAVAPAPSPPTGLPLEELSAILARTAQRVAEHGTSVERRVLDAMSEVTRHVSPGASAALADRDGTEQARLRAFGIVHGAVLHDVSSEERRWLLHQILDGRASSGHPGSDLVA